MDSNERKKLFSASFILTGAACALILLSRCYNNFNDVLPVKGIWTIFSLAWPLLGFWFGMVMRHLAGKPRWWILAIAAAASALVFTGLVTDQVLYFHTHTLRAVLFALLGFIIPTGAYSSSDNSWKNGILLLLSLFAYATCEFARQRLHVGHMADEYAAMQVQVSKVLYFGSYALELLTVWFFAEFSFSGAGQWLGSKRWFRWIAALFVVTVFISILVYVFECGLSWWYLIDIIIQPVVVYVGIVFYRLVFKINR